MFYVYQGKVKGMALKPLRPCAHAGCGELTREKWCPKHKPKHARRVSEEYHDWYATKKWQKMREEHLLSEPFCRECAAGGERVRATVVDHIKPFRGDWDLFCDPENFQSLCKHHHDQKTAREQKIGRSESSSFF